MKTRMLTTGLAVAAALLLAPSAIAVDAPPDSGFGGGTGAIAAPPDSGFGGGTGAVAAPPDSSLGGGTGAVRSDPNHDDELASAQDISLVGILTLRYIPTGYKWLRFAIR